MQHSSCKSRDSSLYLEKIEENLTTFFLKSLTLDLVKRQFQSFCFSDKQNRSDRKRSESNLESTTQSIQANNAGTIHIYIFPKHPDGFRMKVLKKRRKVRNNDIPKFCSAQPIKPETTNFLDDFRNDKEHGTLLSAVCEALLSSGSNCLDLKNTLREKCVQTDSSVDVEKGGGEH